MLLIIPAERELNWRRPPWATLLLIALNLLIFLGYQSHDREKEAQAVQDYLNSDLPRLEFPVYPGYLQREIKLHGAHRGAELKQVREALAHHKRGLLAAHILSDQGFYHYLQKNGGLYWSDKTFAQWRKARAQIETQDLDSLSAFAGGLIPAQLSPPSLITYQFLHGGWGHIIGNMVFLFLVGFPVERALGPLRYLMGYLLCGAVGGLFFSLVNWGSTEPLIGASGAISGLMGMYVAIFRLQKIRFFYWIGFYFSHVRLPALVMLAVWIGKQVLDFVMDGGVSHVAYMCHVGGLAAGAALVYLFRNSWLSVREEFLEPAEDAQEAEFRKHYALALADVGRLEFQRAGLKFQALLRKFPDRLVLREHLFNLARLRPGDENFREQSRAMISEWLKRNQVPRALEIWQDYLKQGEAHHPLAAADHAKVLFACLRQGELRMAEKALGRLRESGDLLLIEEGCRLLVQEYEKRQMTSKAQEYRALLSSLEQAAGATPAPGR